MADDTPEAPVTRATKPTANSFVVTGLMIGGVVAANGVGASSNYRVEAVERRMEKLEQMDRDQERAQAEQVLAIRDMISEIRITIQELRGTMDSTRIIVERIERAKK